MVGQSESDDIFVSELKAKDQELIITGSSVLLSLFQWENKNVDLITMSSLIFGTQKILSGLLCTTILILPHPTLGLASHHPVPDPRGGGQLPK